MKRKLLTILLFGTLILSITACGKSEIQNGINNENNKTEIQESEKLNITLDKNLTFVGNFLNFYNKLPEKTEPTSLLYGNINTPATLENIIKDKKFLSYDLNNTNGGNFEEFKEYSFEDFINNETLIGYNSYSELMLYLNEETYDRYDIVFQNTGTVDIEGENTRTFGEIVRDNYWTIGTPFLRQLGDLFEIKGYENIELSKETGEQYNSFVLDFFQKYGCPDKIFIYDLFDNFTEEKKEKEFGGRYDEYFMYEFDEYIIYLRYTDDYEREPNINVSICSKNYFEKFIENGTAIKLYWTKPVKE